MLASVRAGPGVVGSSGATQVSCSLGKPVANAVVLTNGLVAQEFEDLNVPGKTAFLVLQNGKVSHFKRDTLLARGWLSPAAGSGVQSAPSTVVSLRTFQAPSLDLPREILAAISMPWNQGGLFEFDAAPKLPPMVDPLAGTEALNSLGSIPFWMERAHAATSRTDWTEAEMLLNRVLRLEPEHAEAKRLLTHVRTWTDPSTRPIPDQWP